LSHQGRAQGTVISGTITICREINQQVWAKYLTVFLRLRPREENTDFVVTEAKTRGHFSFLSIGLRKTHHLEPIIGQKETE